MFYGKDPETKVSQDEDDNFQPVITAGNAHCKTIRRQRIESELRRRVRLRDDCCLLKDAFPVSDQQSSVVSLLNRAAAITHVERLEMTTLQPQTRLQQVVNEVLWLRA
jgi:hypothetical protein